MATNSNSQKPKQYLFKFDKEGDVGKWMDVQQNKSRSLGYLIEWAMANFGEVDLIDASMRSTLAGLKPISDKTTTSIADAQNHEPPAQTPPVRTQTEVKTQPNSPKVRTNSPTPRDQMSQITKPKKPDILSSML